MFYNAGAFAALDFFVTNTTNTEFHDDTLGATKSPAPPRKAWEAPDMVELDFGQSGTANTNSNFDGVNYSS